jgi:PTS system N-acetylglucosamine-specific IIC component
VGYLRALGGNQNLKLVDACTTRLRLEIVDGALINEAALRSLGARGVVRPSANALQVVIGPQAEILAGEIREAMAGGEYGPLAPAVTAAAPVAGPDGSTAAVPEPASAEDAAVAQRLVQALGGSANVATAEHIAVTRLRFEVRESGRADEAALQRAGAAGVTKVSASVWHVIAGPHAPAIASALDALLETPCKKPGQFPKK